MKVPVFILSALFGGVLFVGWQMEQKISDFDARLARVETKIDFVTHSQNQIASKGN